MPHPTPKTPDQEAEFLVALQEFLPNDMSSNQLAQLFCFLLESYRVPAPALPALFSAMAAYRNSFPVSRHETTIH